MSALLFPGQGSQYVGMGQNLIDKPGSEAIVEALLPSLIAWMDDQGDLGVQTELEACDHTTASYKTCP